MDIETDNKRASGHYNFTPSEPTEDPASVQKHAKLREAAETATREYAERLKASAEETLPIVKLEIASLLKQLAGLREQERALFEDCGHPIPPIVDVERLRARVDELEAAALFYDAIPTWGIEQAIRDAVKAHLDERGSDDGQA